MDQVSVSWDGTLMIEKVRNYVLHCAGTARYTTRSAEEVWQIKIVISEQLRKRRNLLIGLTCRLGLIDGCSESAGFCQFNMQRFKLLAAILELSTWKFEGGLSRSWELFLVQFWFLHACVMKLHVPPMGGLKKLYSDVEFQYFCFFHIKIDNKWINSKFELKKQPLQFWLKKWKYSSP